MNNYYFFVHVCIKKFREYGNYDEENDVIQSLQKQQHQPMGHQHGQDLKPRRRSKNIAKHKAKKQKIAESRQIFEDNKKLQKQLVEEKAKHRQTKEKQTERADKQAEEKEEKQKILESELLKKVEEENIGFQEKIAEIEIELTEEKQKSNNLRKDKARLASANVQLTRDLEKLREEFEELHKESEKLKDDLALCDCREIGKVN